MTKLLLTFAVACVVVLANSSAAFAGPFDGCDLVSNKDKRTSGRFIWNPKASHFNQAVIVTERAFFPYAPKVEAFTFEGVKIERASLKSTGQCAGWHECLFAATYLMRHLGSRYKNRYEQIIVKVTPSRVTSKAPRCRLYQITRPHRRNEYYMGASN